MPLGGQGDWSICISIPSLGWVYQTQLRLWVGCPRQLSTQQQCLFTSLQLTTFCSSSLTPTSHDWPPSCSLRSIRGLIGTAQYLGWTDSWFFPPWRWANRAGASGTCRGGAAVSHQTGPGHPLVLLQGAAGTEMGAVCPFHPCHHLFHGGWARVGPWRSGGLGGHPVAWESVSLRFYIFAELHQFSA